MDWSSSKANPVALPNPASPSSCASRVVIRTQLRRPTCPIAQRFLRACVRRPLLAVFPALVAWLLTVPEVRIGLLMAAVPLAVLGVMSLAALGAKKAGLFDGVRQRDVEKEIFGAEESSESSAVPAAPQAPSAPHTPDPAPSMKEKEPVKPSLPPPATSSPVPRTGGAAILAQMRARKAAAAAAAARDAPPVVTVIYASQTGTCADIAKMIHAEAVERGIPARVCEGNAVDAVAMTAMSHPVVIVVAASTGDGDPPDSAARFWVGLRRRDADRGQLDGQHYCVLGLGDSNYTKFMEVPREMDKGFSALGSRPFYRNVFADEVDGIDDAVDDWIAGLWDPLREALAKAGGKDRPVAVAAASPAPAVAAKTSTSPTSAAAVRSESSVKDVAWICPADVDFKSVPAPPSAGVIVHDAEGPAPTRPSAEDLAHVDPAGCYTPERPFYATVESSRVLTSHAAEAAGSSPDEWRRVVSVRLATAGSGLVVGPGDAVALMAPNLTDEVDGLLERLGWDGDRSVTLAPSLVDDGGEASPAPALPSHLVWGGGMCCATSAASLAESKTTTTTWTLRDLLTWRLDVMSPARKGLLVALSRACGDEAEARTLRFLASRDGRDHYKAQIMGGHAALLDLLRRFPSCRPGVAEMLAALPALTPRSYSASNDPSAEGGVVEVALSVVRFSSPYRPLRRGLASTWLDGLASGARVALTARPGGLFSPPKNVGTGSPWIMVGPGTGVAPFRGFLRRRRTTLKTFPAEAAGPCVLYFGCRRSDVDYLYRDDLEGFAKDGTLSRLRIAFSRDAPNPRVYVQDLIDADAAELVPLLLQEDAHVFICGDGGAMATAVDQALRRALMRAGGLSEEDAATHLLKMTRAGRFVRDVWCT